MKILSFLSTNYASNTYAVISDNESAIIDPGISVSEFVSRFQFDISTVKYIILTHAHFDHMLFIDDWKTKTNATILVSKSDSKMLSNSSLNCYKQFCNQDSGYFGEYTTISEGDKVILSNESLCVIETPGHTEGTMSFFVDLCENGRTVTAAMHGGAGLNTLSKEYLEKTGQPLEMRDIFKQSLKNLSLEKVDLVLGNHPQQNDTSGKGERAEKGEDILDTSEWQKFLDFHEYALNELIKKEQNV